MKPDHRLAPFIAALATACFPMIAASFSLDQAPGRLPKNVVPQGYNISVVPDVKTLKIAGKESITLDVRAATATIQFNSLNQVLRDVRLDGKPVRRVVSDDKEQLTTVTLKSPVPAGHHTLSFSYTGVIETEGSGRKAGAFIVDSNGSHRRAPYVPLLG
jgi:aminopeptidase N